MSRRSPPAARRRSSCRRNVIFGWIAGDDSGAGISSPDSSDDAARAPLEVRIRVRRGRSCGSPHRRLRALASSAAATAPMPPSGTAHAAEVPSPTSPIEWCAITYPVPGSYGPAHVPIRPFSAITVFTCSDSKNRSRMSTIDIVIRRVTSATTAHAEPPEPPRERELFHARRRTTASRAVGGVRHQERAEHLRQAADPRLPSLERIRVAFRELGELVVVRLRIVRTGRCSARPGTGRSTDRPGCPRYPCRSSCRSCRIVSGIKLIT